MDFDAVNSEAPSHHTNIYVGHLSESITVETLTEALTAHGSVIQVRLYSDRGFAFVRMDSHENAARAICNLDGTIVGGSQIKCAWGRDRVPSRAKEPPSPAYVGPWYNTNQGSHDGYWMPSEESAQHFWPYGTTPANAYWIPSDSQDDAALYAHLPYSPFYGP
jgi:nucleolysin TIA-1/TIAR